jgi:hypothetical protein
LLTSLFCTSNDDLRSVAEASYKLIGLPEAMIYVTKETNQKKLEIRVIVIRIYRAESVTPKPSACTSVWLGFIVCNVGGNCSIQPYSIQMKRILTFNDIQCISKKIPKIAIKKLKMSGKILMAQWC